MTVSATKSFAALGILFALLLIATIALGFPTKAPAVTLDTAHGRWEGLNLDSDQRVFLLYIRGPKDSVAIMSGGPDGNSYVDVFKSATLRVTGGSLVMDAVSASGEHLNIRVSGRATSVGGYLEGDVSLSSGTDDAVSFRTYFMKAKKSYTEYARARISEAERAAGETAVGPGQGTP
jgi:hypothetical protein